ncbi:uncharacterized protein [Chelonus insularis]|uniref:uncharacterized protein n=1 Tax=Chelonus insularis TaxID=460826 RepID=UPI0015890ECD|nr:uncharacterized protein LOC118065669 [Chelonus insularis]
MTSGFDEVEAEYTIHTIICTFMMIMGIFFEVYVIIMFLQIYTNKNASEYSYQEIINQIQAYTRQKQMPVDMKKRLEAYYFYRFGNSYFREKKILSNLSNILREEIALHSCHHLIQNAILFRNTPKNIITSIVSQLRCEIYLPNDVIIKADSYGDCMFFLGGGTVAVFTPTGHEICHLEVGSYFGEVALLVQDQRRVATVIATEVCEVYRLDRRDFRRYVAVHSELFEEIELTATVRIEKAILVEEYYKRHPGKKFK